MQNTMTKVVAGCAALTAIAFTGFLMPKQASAAVPTPRVQQNLTTGVFDWDDHRWGDRDDHRRNDRDIRRFYHRDGDDRRWQNRDRDDRWRDDRRVLHERDWRWHRDHDRDHDRDRDDRGWRW